MAPGTRLDPMAREGKIRSLKRRSARVAVCLCLTVCAVAVVSFLFRGAILNTYVRGAAERAFAKAHPGYTVHLGELHHAFAANQLRTESATIVQYSHRLRVNRPSRSIQ